MSLGKAEAPLASELATQLVEMVGVPEAVRAVIGVAPNEPWAGPRPHVSWAELRKVTEALRVLLQTHGAALDLLLPNAGLVVAEAQQLLARHAANPTLGASVVWHAESLVQLWCFVEQVAAKGKQGRERILQDAAKRGYGVRALVSSPRPRSSMARKIISFDALKKAYEKAQRLLASVPEAHAYFRASIEAYNECPDRMGGYQRLFHQKLLAAGFPSSERPGAIAEAYAHWVGRLEEARRAQVAEAHRVSPARRRSKAK